MANSSRFTVTKHTRVQESIEYDYQLVAEHWNKIIKVMRESLSPTTFEKYIKELAILNVESECLYLKQKSNDVPQDHYSLITTYILNAREKLLKYDGKSTFSKVYIFPSTLAGIGIAGSKPKDLSAGKVVGQVNADKKLKNYIVGNCNKVAYNCIKRLIKGRNNQFLFISGKNGLGKSHLAHAALNKISRSSDLMCRLDKGTELLSQISKAYRENSWSTLQKELCNLDFWVIDGLDEIINKSRTVEEVIKALEVLENANKRVLIISNLAVGDKTWNSRMGALIRKMTTIEVNHPDYELGLKLVLNQLNKKAHKSLVTLGIHGVSASLQNITKPLTASDYIGIGKRIEAELLYNTGCSIEDIQRIIQNLALIGTDPLSIPMHEVIKAVCEHFGMTKEKLLSADRKHSVLFPRQLAMYLCRTICERSYPEIAEAFGGKCHTTCIHAVKRITEILAKDPYWQQQEKEVRSRLPLN